MSGPHLYSLADAPAGARAALEEARRTYGFVPNLIAAMADSPPLVTGYWALAQAFYSGTLSPAEREVITLAVSYHHRCTYCLAGHAMMAANAGVPPAEVEALRSGRAIADPRLEALRNFVQRALDRRGRPDPEAEQALLAAGFTRQQLLEVPLGIAYKTLSNYSHHLLDVPVDSALATYRWTAPPGPTKVLITGRVRADGAEALRQYQSAASPIMKAHGGRPLVRAGESSPLVGHRPDLVVLLEFPTAEAAAGAFADPAYAQLTPVRERAFEHLDVVAIGGDK